MAFNAKFWETADQCKHVWYSHYYRSIYCDTPYCNSGAEEHCVKCGVYYSKCPCGCSNGMSGWSVKRWRTHTRKKHNGVVR